MSHKRWFQDLTFTPEELAAFRADHDSRASLRRPGSARRRFPLSGAASSRVRGRLQQAAGAALLEVESLPAHPLLGGSAEDGGTGATADADDMPIEVDQFHRERTAEFPRLAEESLTAAAGPADSARDERGDRSARVSLLLSALLPKPSQAGGEGSAEAASPGGGAADSSAAAGLAGTTGAGPAAPHAAPREGLAAAQRQPAGAVKRGLRRKTTAARGSPAVGQSTASQAPATPTQQGVPALAHSDASRPQGSDPAVPGQGAPAHAGSAEPQTEQTRGAGDQKESARPAPSSPFPLASDMSEDSAGAAAASASNPAKPALQQADSDIDVVIDVDERQSSPAPPRKAGRTSEQELSGADLEDVAEPPPLPVPAPERVLSEGSPELEREVRLPLASRPAIEGAAEIDGVITSAEAQDTAASTPAGAVAGDRHETPPMPPVPDAGLAQASPKRETLPMIGQQPAMPPPVAPPRLQRRGTGTVGSAVWFERIFDEDYLRSVPYISSRLTRSEVDFMLDSLTLGKESRLLDLGCGVGRHCIELAARGYNVVGVDRVEAFIERAKRDAQKRGVQPSFLQQDFRELDAVERFDAAYCMGTTFGYFDDETNRRVVQSVCRALKPSGQLLIEVANRDYLIRGLPTRVGWEGDGCVVLEEVDFSFFNSRLTSKRSVVFMDGRHLEHDISLRLYSLHELGKLMHQVGFKVVEVSGHIAHRSHFFGNASRSLIVLAERR